MLRLSVQHMELLLPSQGSMDPAIKVEMGVAPLTATPSDSLAKFSLPVPVILCSAGLQVLVQVLVPKGKMLPPGDTTMIPLDRKLRLMPGHFGLLLPLSDRPKRGFCIGWGDGSELPRGNWTAAHSGGKEAYVCSRRLLRAFLGLIDAP